MAPIVDPVTQLRRASDANALRAKDVLRRLEERDGVRGVVEEEQDEPLQSARTTAHAIREPAIY
jgi:hypothetical protein